MIESLMPVSSWGQTFYAVPFPDRTNNYELKIVASVANTAITKDGAALATIATVGNFYSMQSKDAMMLKADQNVEVAQLAVGSPATTHK